MLMIRFDLEHLTGKDAIELVFHFRLSLKNAPILSQGMTLS